MRENPSGAPPVVPPVSNQEVIQPTLDDRPSAPSRRRVMHYYPGFVELDEWPPAGAVALCGYVRRAEDCDGSYSMFGEPDACVVCDEMLAS